MKFAVLAALLGLNTVEANGTKLSVAQFQQYYLDYSEEVDEQDVNLQALRKQLDAELHEKQTNVKLRKVGVEKAKAELVVAEKLVVTETGLFNKAQQELNDHIVAMTHEIAKQCLDDHAKRLAFIKKFFPSYANERAVRAKHQKLEALMNDAAPPFDPVWDATPGRCVNMADYEPHLGLLVDDAASTQDACTAACIANDWCVAHAFGLAKCTLYKKADGIYMGDKMANPGYMCKAHRTRDVGHAVNMISMLEELE